jgi:ribosomal protein S18 acetylase RimI-like enzyme
MPPALRRLGPGDEPTLALLSRDDADFDIPGRPHGRAPLSPSAAAAFLGDGNMLCWVAEADGEVLGFLFCHRLPMRDNKPAELLLYEIGVRTAARRQGVGRALVDGMYAFMAANDIDDVWVLADNPGAVEFYRACGFAMSEGQATYMTARRQR